MRLTWHVQIRVKNATRVSYYGISAFESTVLLETENELYFHEYIATHSKILVGFQWKFRNLREFANLVIATEKISWIGTSFGGQFYNTVCWLQWMYKSLVCSPFVLFCRYLKLYAGLKKKKKLHAGFKKKYPQIVHSSNAHSPRFFQKLKIRYVYIPFHFWFLHLSEL